MSAMSDNLEAALLNHLFRTATYSKPTQIGIALCTAATSDSQTGATITEVSAAGNYARVSVPPADANWSAPAAPGLIDNAVAFTFPVATSAWGTITHVAICDATATAAGNLVLHGALTSSKVVGIGDTFRFSIGDLDITFA